MNNAQNQPSVLSKSQHKNRRRRQKANQAPKQQVVPMSNKQNNQTSAKRTRGPRRRNLYGGEYGDQAQALVEMEGGRNPYLKMLLQPKYSQMRYPDEYSRPTALYTSYEYLDIIGNFASGTAGVDKGKFSYIFRPIISSLVALNEGADYGASVFASSSATWADSSIVGWIGTTDANTIPLIGVQSSSDPAAFSVVGIVENYRPIAMSVWAEFTGDTLTDGGNIAAAIIDGGTVDNFWTTPPPAPGFLSEFKNLAAVPGAYEGKLKTGSYSYWTPWDAEDTVFKYPLGIPNVSPGGVAAEEYDWPAIVVSGITTNILGGTIGRIEVVRVFEYTTTSRLVQTEPSPISPNLIVAARSDLQLAPSSMANEDHDGVISQLLSNPVLQKVIKVGAPALGFAMGRASGAPLGGIRGAILARRMSKLMLS